MGRRKIEIKLIDSAKSRASSFSKRKKGFFKKMDDLSDLTNASVCCIMQTQAHNYFWHTAGDKTDEMEEMIPVIIKSIDKSAEKQSHFFANKRNKKNFKHTKEMKEKLAHAASRKLTADSDSTASSKPKRANTRSRAKNNSQTSAQMTDSPPHSNNMNDMTDAESFSMPSIGITTRSGTKLGAVPEEQQGDTAPFESDHEDSNSSSSMHFSHAGSSTSQRNKNDTKQPKTNTQYSKNNKRSISKKKTSATGSHDADTGVVFNQYDDGLGHILSSPSFAQMVSPTTASSLISPSGTANHQHSSNKIAFLGGGFASPRMAQSLISPPPSAGTTKAIFQSPRSSRPKDGFTNDGGATMTPAEMDTPRAFKDIAWKSHSDEFMTHDMLIDQPIVFGLEE